MPPMLVCGAMLQKMKGDSYILCNMQQKLIILNFRGDMTKEATDFEQRTIQGLLETDRKLLKTAKLVNIRMGRINNPLLKIPLENVIPDELHLLLRVMDVLIRNLIHAAGTYDAKNSRRGNDILDGVMVKKLLECIRGCGVSFTIYDSTKKAFDFTSLVDGDKIKLLTKLPAKLKDCQPVEFADTVEQLWKVKSNIKLC